MKLSTKKVLGMVLAGVLRRFRHRIYNSSGCRHGSFRRQPGGSRYNSGGRREKDAESCHGMCICAI